MMRSLRNFRIVCYALDPAKYKHTVMPSSGEASNDSRLVNDFKTYFPSLAASVKDKTSLLRMVSFSSEVREWYKAWQKSEANAVSFPEWLDKTKEADLAAFDKLSSARADLATKEKEWNEKVVKASETMKAVIKSVDNDKNDYYKRLDNLLKINNITVNNLPLDTQAKLAAVADDRTRKVETKKALLAHQRKLKSDLDNSKFQDPFA